MLHSDPSCPPCTLFDGVELRRGGCIHRDSLYQSRTFDGRIEWCRSGADRCCSYLDQRSLSLIGIL